MRRSTFTQAILAGVALIAFTNAAQAVPQVFRDTGNATSDIQGTFDAMIAALGEPNNGNSSGPIATGHRGINWDAGIVPFDMPANFFNGPFPPTRGAVMRTTSNEFRVSNDGSDNEFDTFNSDHPNQFTTFSPSRLFSPFDTTILNVDFFVPATTQPATVRGFGAVFTDVDLVDVTQIEWLDSNGNVLLDELVDPEPQGLSFLGAVFDAPIVRSVRITLGNTTLQSGEADDPSSDVDVVVLDDFLYGEPQAVPEPGTLALIGAGLAGLALARRRRA